MRNSGKIKLILKDFRNAVVFVKKGIFWFITLLELALRRALELSP